MGCQSEVVLGANLTFTITTHDADTGALTDADGPPAYRVYENETAVPILTGTMTVLDDLNTVGFYSEQIACTTANGFEDGKTYNIYIQAQVDGDVGGIAYSFRVHSVLNETLEGAYTVADALQIVLSVLAGKLSGGGTATVTFRDVNDTVNRVVATVTADGNRTAVVLTV